MLKTTNKPLHPVYGTSLYIGEFPLETIYGEFKLITFQDIITKGYILALFYGSLDAEELYTRIHSSCVTSETLGSMDCDCVQQLDGALKKITQSGNGILFYLMQEGRGVGYVAKSRDCMNVQHGLEKNSGLDTFGAYKLLGLKSDYRDYRNVKDILHIFRLEHKKFVLLTNNPDKIRSFDELQLSLARVEAIEFEPNPFNANYLRSKEKIGHLLVETKKKIPKYHLPYKRVEPFEPYALENYRRFVHVASYFLPIRPIDNKIIIKEENLKDFTENSNKNDQYITWKNLYDNVCLVEVQEEELFAKYKHNFLQPHWFKTNVFYDIGTSQDYVVLTYGELIEKKLTTVIKPLVCIRSESITNRFPLKNLKYKTRFRNSIHEIACRGSGLLILLHDDGRGFGFSHFVLDMVNSKHGISEDRRDFTAICQLIDTFIGSQEFDISCGTKLWNNLKLFLNKFSLKVRSFIPPSLEEDDGSPEKLKKDCGYDSIFSRIQDLSAQFSKSLQFLPEWREFFSSLSATKLYLTTGIGSSEAHAVYLSHFHEKIAFKAFGYLTKDNKKYVDEELIVFSQGLTPNIEQITENFPLKNTVFVTSVSETSGKAERKIRYKKFKENGARFLQFQEEEFDDTLIRITGPAVVFYLIYSCFKGNPPALNYQRPSQNFLAKVKGNSSFVLVVPANIKRLCENLRSKFFEGVFINEILITDCVSFSHGPLQFAVKNHANLVICARELEYMEELIKETGLNLDVIHSEDEESLVIELEIYFNYLVYDLLLMKGCDQKHWPGKGFEKINYQKERKFE